MRDDLACWRLRDSNRAELEHITNTALDLDGANVPSDELRRVLQDRIDIVKSVGSLAASAAAFAWSQDADALMMEGSPWSSYCELMDEAECLSRSLKEIVELYASDPHLLRSSSREQSLAWYTLF